MATHHKKKSRNKPNPQQEADDIGYWQQMVAQQKESGLSQVNFAKEHKISLRKFKRLKKQLEPAQNSPKPSNRQASQGVQASKAQNQANNVSSSVSALGKDQVELRHQSGFTVVYHDHVQEGLLRKALKALSELGKD